MKRKTMAIVICFSCFALLLFFVILMNPIYQITPHIVNLYEY